MGTARRLSPTKPAARPHAKVARIAWEGEEEGAPCCGLSVEPADGGVPLSQWFAPGQMELYMLD